ncbi:hypothetical protein PtrSN002B_004724 [Pyrenophora tritici-repentis]|uniref:Uncharacterized protein n=2 Tax=Pyrenophora tritici-repentis TaxID=45151 RepID=A0A2W1F7V2_9PLEO|nr:uncharacterized protein PTRG_09606 [Pyrenophora tritici-repentis Pt-1C-BFP]KAA8617784.1 hypothetical protein PtrV1_09291 [Pyrenophora tritici-repentis]EDU42657.1 predicted protein [Pyrenophora tritici-repentis Pt-1C-BFP]KAF7443266.1 hypothetical protein A1F99_127730 [Pyrenophora tritici-repentis]KAF7568257.1 hypothetical protein PtrM4_128700 [Pyrenophora tritici-repentis]KAG9377045.1 hypothetical protein A1F94_012645 [Pyrenophora tritici-repentis]
MAPHLLTIPREIRDEIYSYLYEKVDVQVSMWCSRDTSDSSVSIGDICYDATLENTLILNILLTNSQMHDEYLEAACFKNPRMEFYMHVYGSEAGDVLDTTLLEGDYMDYMKKALGKAHEITMICEFGSRFPEFLWPSVLGVTTAFQPYMSNVSTMRILAGRADYFNLEDELDEALQGVKEHDRTLASATSYMFLLPPPAKLIGLPLRQCAQGYSYRASIYPGPGRQIFDVDVPGAWVFARETINIPWAELSDIKDCCSWRSLPEDEFIIALGVDEKAARILEKGIIWAEKRGDDVYAWGIRE